MVTWGNNTTQVFGTATPAAAPGATPAPATGFSFGGGTPAAGGPSPSTPPVFSTPAPSAPPPLGSSGAGGFSFGGASAPSAAPSTGGGLFGAPAPAPAPSTMGGGLFGAPAPAPSTGLFGATSPAPSTSLFGAPAAAAPAAFGAFSSTPAAAANPYQQQQQQQQQQYQQQQYQQQAPHQAAYAAHQSAAQRQEAARLQEAILSLHSKYSPHASDPLNPSLGSNAIPSSLCRFTAIFYDPLAPEQRAAGSSYVASSSSSAIASGVQYGGAIHAPKPPHISNQDWNEALARNPNPGELCPVPLVGASSLHSRLVSQQEKANAFATHATTLRDTLSYLETQARKSNEAIRHSNNEQEELRRRLLEIMRKVEIVRCMGHPLQHGEVDAMGRLNDICRKTIMVEKGLMEVEERGRQQARAWRMRASTVDARGEGGAGSSSSLSSSLAEEEKYALFQVMNDQRMGMERLGSIVKRDARDVNILKEEMSKASTSTLALRANSRQGAITFR